MSEEKITQDELKKELKTFLQLHGYIITQLIASENTIGPVKQFWIGLKALRVEISENQKELKD